MIKDRVLNPAVPVGTGPAGAVLPVAATDDNGDGLIAWQSSDLTIHARQYTNRRASRDVQLPQGETPVSAAPTDAADGLEAAADRAGDIAIGFVQGPAGARSLAIASFDRAPGAFRLSSGSSFRNVGRTPLKWTPSFELWGGLTYTVEVDGRVAGQTTAPSLALPTLPNGVHRWRVIATDRRGQVTATPLRSCARTRRRRARPSASPARAGADGRSASPSARRTPAARAGRPRASGAS